jgi:hypothetical protein
MHRLSEKKIHYRHHRHHRRKKDTTKEEYKAQNESKEPASKRKVHK